MSLHDPSKVDTHKVNMDVIKPWITRRITELLGMEDDVVIEFCFNLLEKNQVSYLNSQIQNDLRIGIISI